MMSSGKQQVREPRGLPEEWQHVYELAVSNAKLALCLTTDVAAVCRRNAWWESVARAVSALGHHHRSARGAWKRLQDTLRACKHKLQGVTAHGVAFEGALQKLLWGREAVLRPVMQQLLVKGWGVKSHPGELCLKALFLCMCSLGARW